MVFIYYFLTFSTIAFMPILNIRCKYRDFIYLFIFFTICFFVMGFRNPTVGTDTITYIGIFNNLSTFKFSSYYFSNKSMYVYSLYNILISLVSTKDQWLIICNSFILCVLFGIFIYRFCRKNLALSCLLLCLTYFLFSSFNITRQFLAIGVASNSLYYLIKNNQLRKKIDLLKFLILFTLSFFIHNIVIIFLIAIPLIYSKSKSFKIVYSYLMPILFIMFFLFAQPIISNLFPYYKVYFQDGAINSFSESSSSGRSTIVYLIYLSISLLYLYILIHYNLISSLSYLDIAIFCLFNIFTIFGLLSSFNSLMSRFTYVFCLFVLPFMINFFKCFNPTERKILLSLFCLILFIPFYIQLNNNIGGIRDYNFF